MHHDAKLDLRLPAAARKELDALASEVGLSTADVARIGLRWLLLHREALLKLPPPPAGEASP
jgi:hypothetical protein